MATSCKSGYLTRTNVFRQRFIGCDDLGVLHDGSAFGQYVTAHDGQDFFSLLDSCLFMFVRITNGTPLCKDITLVEEVDARMNFSWLLDYEPKEKTLVIVWAHYNPTSYLPLYQAAKELGMKVVVIDHREHWIAGHSFRHMYDVFIPVDMTPDVEWDQRIVAAVKEYGEVDGLCAIATHVLAVVARAAASLGLPTSPPEAIARAVSKFDTRVIAGGYTTQDTALVTDLNHLKTLMADEAFVPQYPLIAKPNLGAASFQVYRINTDTELLDAVDRIRQITGQGVAVEPYIEGPELDVNLVLLDGELLFFEVADDFPSAGDHINMDRDFFETALSLPSRLPPEEYEVVRQKLHRLLLRMGLKTGVFHLEARMQNSSMAYSEDESGIMDLKPNDASSRPDRQGQAPRCCLIEINPRSPGYKESFVTKTVHGVNLLDLHILSSIGDYERMRSLSKAFEPGASLPGHARAWSHLVYMRVKEGGICESGDVCGDVLLRLEPRDRAMVTDAICCYGRGDRVPTPLHGSSVLAAGFIVTNRENYYDNLRVAKLLREKFSMPLRPS